MPEFPRGTITFLFTDIEGSTRHSPFTSSQRRERRQKRSLAPLPWSCLTGDRVVSIVVD